MNSEHSRPREQRPPESEPAWQLKLLITIIAVGVLGLILKTFGVI